MSGRYIIVSINHLFVVEDDRVFDNSKFLDIIVKQGHAVFERPKYNIFMLAYIFQDDNNYLLL